MQGAQLTTLTGIILALEFAAFGWRVNREINVADEDRRTWLPLPDMLNIAALFLVVYFCIVVPLAQGDYVVWSRRVLAGAGALIAFHPVTMAAHYGLPYRKQRWKGGRFPVRAVRGDRDVRCLCRFRGPRRMVNQWMINTTEPDNSRVDRSARTSVDMNLECYTRARSRDRWAADDTN